MNNETKKFSVSQLGTFQFCSYKHFLTYRKLYRPLRYNPNFYEGLIVHKAMERYPEMDIVEATNEAIKQLDEDYKAERGQSIFESDENIELFELEVRAIEILQHYAYWNQTQIDNDHKYGDHQFEIVAKELELTVEIRPGYFVDLYVDEVLLHKTNGKYYLREFKTNSNLKSFRENMEYDIQPIVYIEAIEKHLGQGIVIEGVLYDMFLKRAPELKFTKSGDISEDKRQALSPEGFLMLAVPFYKNRFAEQADLIDKEWVIKRHQKFYAHLVATKSDYYFQRFLWNPHKKYRMWLDEEDAKDYDVFDNTWRMIVDDIDRMNTEYAPSGRYSRYSCTSFKIPCEFSEHCKARIMYGDSQAQKVLDKNFVQVERIVLTS